MPRITFLDAATVGDTLLDELASLGELTCHDVTGVDDTIHRLQGSDIAITNKVVIDAETIAACSQLKLICIAATGMNCVDLDAADAAGIPVKNVAGYSTAGVTQHSLGLLINLASNLHRYAAESEAWPHSPIFTRLDHPIVDLNGKTLGIVGLGTIGKSVAQAATALGMKVIAYQREGSQSSDSEIPRLSHDEFFSSADAVSLHCPLTPETHHIINQESLRLMKQSAFLINTGRGDLIDENALAASLKARAIAGAALDVLSAEPPAEDHVLLDPSLPNLIITPHTAWASAEARDRLMQGVCQNIREWMSSSPSG